MVTDNPGFQWLTTTTGYLSPGLDISCQPAKADSSHPLPEIQAEEAGQARSVEGKNNGGNSMTVEPSGKGSFPCEPPGQACCDWGREGGTLSSEGSK